MGWTRSKAWNTGKRQEVETFTGTSLPANRRVIVRSDLETKGDGRKVAVQHFDQLGRVRLSRTLEDASTESPYNEQHGIKVQTRYLTTYSSPDGFTYQLTSNPYRAATSSAATGEETMGWTRSKAWNTGKRQEVETFTGTSLPAPWGSNTNSTGVVTTETDADRTLVTDQAGKSRISKTNALGQLKEVWEILAASETGSASVTFPGTSIAHGFKTTYSYDTLNNLITVSQGVQTRSFSYSSLSRLLTASNPEGGAFQYTYDPNGNLLTKTDARSIVTTYTYDVHNRVTFGDYSDSTPDITYTYDDPLVPFSIGKLTKVASNISTTAYIGFDAAERITGSRQTTDGHAYTFGYTYYLGGDLKTQTYPSGKTVEYDYDSSGDLALVGKQTEKGLFIYANSFSYAPHGQVEKVRLGNGKWETTEFNSDRQITQVGLGHSATNTGLWKINYEYGEWNGTTIDPLKNNGSLARQTITVPTFGTATGFTAVQTYTYDSLDRIKSATEKIAGSQTWKQAFVYDRFGNRNFDTGNTTIQSTESALAKITNPEILISDNRIKEDQDGDSQPDYLYDLSGNITKNAREQIFTYDAENRQITGTGTGLSTEYSYDGNGKRVKSHDAVTNQTTIFVYDAEGDLSAEYTINIPPPANPTISYLTEDALGSVRVATNSFGEIKARRDFLPFGEELYAGLAGRNTNQKYSSSTDDTRKKFATYQRDAETGLDFAQSRYYSPMHGRFTSPDEFKGGPDELFDFEEDASDNPTFYADLENPQSLNKYQYTYNNPYKFNDPTGHCPFCVAFVVIAVAIATGPDYAVAPTGRETREEMSSYRNTYGGNALLNVGPAKGVGIAGSALRPGAQRIAARGARATVTEIRARSLVRTVKKQVAKGGDQPGKSAKPIRANRRTIKRAGKIWTKKGQPLKGRAGSPAPKGLANKKTGRSFREPTKKVYSKRKVANFQSTKPKANVHVEMQ